MGTENRVWKYVLPHLNSVKDSAHRFKVEMPRGATILKMGFGIDKEPTIWVQVMPGEPLVEYNFASIGTGHGVVPDGYEYLDSITVHGFVWHVFIVAAEYVM